MVHTVLNRKFLGQNWWKWLFFLVILATAALIGWVDYYTGPTLTITVLYFIPIAIAAWRLGRSWALGVVAANIIPAYLDQAALAHEGEYSFVIAFINILAPTIAYVFIVELVSRVVRSQTALANTADRLRKVYDEVEDDVTAASLLQAAVLREPVPSIGGLDLAMKLVYARTIGGDFLEAIRVGDDLHLVIADVAGKSVQAALFTTLLKHLLGEARDISTQPDDVIRYVNSQLEKRLPEEVFLSLLYITLSVRNKELRYVNAGHEPALLYRKSSGAIEELGTSVTVMGLIEYPETIQPGKAKLASGDILLLYTDGITDAKKISGERVGADFLKQAILELRKQTADEIVEGIMQRVQAKTVPVLRDDMTLACVKVLPSSETPTGS